MLFRLKTVLEIFQRFRNQTLLNFQNNKLFVYLDDFVTYSSLSEHDIKFNKLAHRLRKYKLKLQSNKYKFLRKEETYLRHNK